MMCGDDTSESNDAGLTTTTTTTSNAAEQMTTNDTEQNARLTKDLEKVRLFKQQQSTKIKNESNNPFLSLV